MSKLESLIVQFKNSKSNDLRKDLSNLLEVFGVEHTALIKCVNLSNSAARIKFGLDTVVMNEISNRFLNLQKLTGDLKKNALMDSWRRCQVNYSIDGSSKSLEWKLMLNNDPDLPYFHELSDVDGKIKFVSIEPVVTPFTGTSLLTSFPDFKENSVSCFYLEAGISVETCLANMFGGAAYLQVIKSSECVVPITDSVETYTGLDKTDFFSLFGVTRCDSHSVTVSELIIPRSLPLSQDVDKCSSWLSWSNGTKQVSVPIPSNIVCDSSLNGTTIAQGSLGAVALVNNTSFSFTRSTQNQNLQRVLTMVVINFVNADSVLGRSNNNFKFVLIYPADKDVCLFNKETNISLYHTILEQKDINTPYYESNLTCAVVDKIGNEVFSWVNYSGNRSKNVNRTGDLIIDSDDPTTPDTEITLTRTYNIQEYGVFNNTGSAVSGSIMCLAPPIGTVYAQSNLNLVLDNQIKYITSKVNSLGGDIKAHFIGVLKSLVDMGHVTSLIGQRAIILDEQMEYMRVNVVNLYEAMQTLSNDYATFKSAVVGKFVAEAIDAETQQDFVHRWVPIIVGLTVAVAVIAVSVLTFGVGTAIIVPAITLATIANFATTTLTASIEAFKAGDTETGMYYLINTLMLVGGASTSVKEVSGLISEGSSVKVKVSDVGTEKVQEANNVFSPRGVKNLAQLTDEINNNLPLPQAVSNKLATLASNLEETSNIMQRVNDVMTGLGVNGSGNAALDRALSIMGGEVNSQGNNAELLQANIRNITGQEVNINALRAVNGVFIGVEAVSSMYGRLSNSSDYFSSMLSRLKSGGSEAVDRAMDSFWGNSIKF